MQSFVHCEKNRRFVMVILYTALGLYKLEHDTMTWDKGECFGGSRLLIQAYLVHPLVEF
jgi:hypothetical protein